MNYRDFAPTSETERRMEHLIEIARILLRRSVNPAYDADDWTPVGTFPRAVSPN